ncbi:N-6 DNA methylase [Thermoactinospora rubra]|uniref:N-6 DNA methylase n=1 Tax=Thermoactinospora rubra TaxID=1088767 RepID=UPI000A11E83E|nr:N-6 DNA methylase [Thermoactinospora rubra]
MNQDPTVNAGDIARLAGVGRAAVSNWRRRHDDFPQPVGGTASQPLFSLRQIEAWLSRYGKSYQVSLADRVWQRLKAAGDLRLGELVAAAGALLTGQDHALERDVAALVSELAAEQGAARAYELLCERYLEAHSRQLSVTRPELAALMVELAGAKGGTVLDPACGVGTLLLAAEPYRALGQELSETSARIAAARLRLRGIDGRVAAGDSLRRDAFDGEQADAVVCDPPFGERAWGYEELVGDTRWEYGVPPRGEPELAWVQHCLTHVKPGGTVVVLMPPAAASRKAGRRIRANLLRAGALRAVVSLGAGDLWLLRRPRPGDRPPGEVLLMEGGPGLTATAVARREGNVRIIDLLTDDVDLTPARHKQRDDLGRSFAEARERYLATSAVPPDLKVLERPVDHPATTVGELVRAGLITVAQAPARMSLNGGEVPVLTADDLLYGTPPSGRTGPGEDLVPVEPGDVVASYSTVRVVTFSGSVLGPHLTLYRVDPAQLDPDFLAGFLRSAGSRTTTGSSRFDARRTRLPRLPLAEQRRYGQAFRRLTALEDALRETTALGQALVDLGFEGLAEGHLRP